MKLNMRPAPKDLGTPHVYEFSSASRANVSHFVFVYSDQRGVVCSCEGWKTHGHCWHIGAIPNDG